MVEFALVLPLFLILIFGLVDLGRAVYANNTLSNAARTGARLGIVNQDVASIQQAASHQAVALAVAESDVTVDFRNPDDTGPCPASPPPIGCVVVVAISYQFNAAVPVIGQIVGSIHMSSSSSMRIEREYHP